MRLSTTTAGLMFSLLLAQPAFACSADFYAASVDCSDNLCFVDVAVNTRENSTQVRLAGTIHAKREISIFTADGDQIDRTILEDIPFDTVEDASYGDDLGDGTWLVSFSVNVPNASAKILGREFGRLNAMGDGDSSTGGYLEFDRMGYASCKTLY